MLCTEIIRPKIDIDDILVSYTKEYYQLLTKKIRSIEHGQRKWIVPGGENSWNNTLVLPDPSTVSPKIPGNDLVSKAKGKNKATEVQDGVDEDSVVELVNQYRQAEVPKQYGEEGPNKAVKALEPIDEFLYHQVNEECTARLPLLPKKDLSKEVLEGTKRVSDISLTELDKRTKEEESDNEEAGGSASSNKKPVRTSRGLGNNFL